MSWPKGYLIFSFHSLLFTFIWNSPLMIARVAVQSPSRHIDPKLCVNMPATHCINLQYSLFFHLFFNKTFKKFRHTTKMVLVEYLKKLSKKLKIYRTNKGSLISTIVTSSVNSTQYHQKYSQKIRWNTFSNTLWDFLKETPIFSHYNPSKGF